MRHEMIGKVFGRLRVAGVAPSSTTREKRFSVVCVVCGHSKEMSGGNIRRAGRVGGTGGCCGERIRAARVAPANAWRARWYGVWNGMMRRCYSSDHVAFHRYGGRGITVCDAWHTFDAFSEWLIASGWEPGLQIDRVDNDLGYSPDNCRIATAKENANNKSTNRKLIVCGESMTITQAARRFGFNKTTIKERLNRGWSDEDAVSKIGDISKSITPVARLDKCSGERVVFSSIARAVASIPHKSKSVGHAISHCCAGRLKSAYGYKWEYANAK